MNQVISQHGWGLDQNIWNRLKDEFSKKNWIWQDNDRGYYSDSPINVKWIKDDSDQKIKVAVCHSLGIHLIEKEILKEASHIVLINSFNNFIPTNNERNITLRTLRRMENKINKLHINLLLKEFITRSFLPHKVNTSFKAVFNLNSKQINVRILLNDFQKLYLEKKTFNLFSRSAKVLIIKSKNDFILKEYASNEFINLLNNSQLNKPKLVQIENQGHLIGNNYIVKVLKDWLEIF